MQLLHCYINYVSQFTVCHVTRPCYQFCLSIPDTLLARKSCETSWELIAGDRRGASREVRLPSAGISSFLSASLKRNARRLHNGQTRARANFPHKRSPVQSDRVYFNVKANRGSSAGRDKLYAYLACPKNVFLSGIRSKTQTASHLASQPETHCGEDSLLFPPCFISRELILALCTHTWLWSFGAPSLDLPRTKFGFSRFLDVYQGVKICLWLIRNFYKLIFINCVTL